MDEEALNQARQATYDTETLEPVPAAFREKYVETAGQRHVVRSDLRRAIIIGRHDVMRNAPIFHFTTVAAVDFHQGLPGSQTDLIQDRETHKNRNPWNLRLTPPPAEDGTLPGTGVSLADISPPRRPQAEPVRIAPDPDAGTGALQAARAEMEDLNAALQVTNAELETSNAQCESSNSEISCASWRSLPQMSLPHSILTTQFSRAETSSHQLQGGVDLALHA